MYSYYRDSTSIYIGSKIRHCCVYSGLTEVPERPTGSGSPSNQTAVARKPVTGTPTKTQQQQQPDVRATKTPQQQQPDVRATKTPQQQQPDVRATKTPQQQQPDVRATKTPQQPDVIATPISSVAELSNVPLDTPPPSRCPPRDRLAVSIGTYFHVSSSPSVRALL